MDGTVIFSLTIEVLRGDFEKHILYNFSGEEEPVLGWMGIEGELNDGINVSKLGLWKAQRSKRSVQCDYSTTPRLL